MGLEHLIWDLDDMDESGLQRCGRREESSAGVLQEFKQDFGGWNINRTRKDKRLGWLVQDRAQQPCIIGYNVVFDD